jgi:hypothetical protein
MEREARDWFFEKKLVLFTKKELHKLPPWTLVTSITGETQEVQYIDIDSQDTRGQDQTAWGLPEVEYDIIGKMVVKRVLG